MGIFEKEVKLTQNKLKLNENEHEEYKEWEERYAKYIELMVNHKKNAIKSFNEFHSFPQFQYYLTIGDLKGAVNDFHFSVRYMGQEVATIVSKLTNGEILITAKKKNVTSDIQEETAPEIPDKTPWHSTDATKFRNYYGSHPVYKGVIGEHRLENELFAQLSETVGEKKLLIGIQPIQIASSLRFPLTTPLSASGDQVKYATVGGGIDILASCDNKLTVIELKKEYQSPEIVMKQALRYATFLQALLRSEKEIPPANSNEQPKISGQEWYKFLKTTKDNKGNPDFPKEGLVINVVVAMPRNSYGLSDKSFAFDEIDMGNKDKLILHYMYLTIDEEYKITEIDSSLKKTEEEKQEILKIKEIQKAELKKQKENSIFSITAHRGSDEIGGTVTEIASKNSRILIDFGSQLEGAEKITEVDIEWGTEDNPKYQAVLLTHYHGDHIGEIHQIPDFVPVYFGKTAREISLVLSKKLETLYKMKREKQEKSTDNTDYVQKLEEQEDKTKILVRAIPYQEGESFQIPNTDINVTPYHADHSAYDSYMLHIKSGGKSILHTGDFRFHGYTGQKTLENLDKIKNVDYLISEGTMMSRNTDHCMTEKMTEKKLSEKATEYTQKYVFFLCSSTNIDHIYGLYSSLPQGKPLLCDKFQRDILEKVQQDDKNETYIIHNDNIKTLPQKYNEFSSEDYPDGFCMLVRKSKYSNFFQEVLAKFKDNPESVLLYCLWDGYRKGKKHQDDEVVFLEELYSDKFIPHHASGHAYKEDLKTIIETMKPKKVLPIHTENQQGFEEISGNSEVIFLQNGVTTYL